MDLASFVGKVRSPVVFTWLGDASVWRQKRRPDEIARQAGLAPPADALRPLDPTLAAKVFAYLRSESLTHGRKRYRAGFFSECRDMLGELGDGSQFYSNSDFEGWFQDGPEPAGWGFTPLTDFDIDTGIVGVSSDGRCGFVFWRGENS